MVDLLQQIRARMAELPVGTKVRQLTAALSSSTRGQSMGGRIAGYVDHINVMIYDTYGTEEEGYPHAPMRVLKESLAGYAAAGVPNSKIIVGVPFYGGDKSVSPVITQPYNTLCAMAGGAITASSNSYGGYAFQRCRSDEREDAVRAGQRLCGAYDLGTFAGRGLRQSAVAAAGYQERCRRKVKVRSHDRTT